MVVNGRLTLVGNSQGDGIGFQFVPAGTNGDAMFLGDYATIQHSPQGVGATIIAISANARMFSGTGTWHRINTANPAWTFHMNNGNDELLIQRTAAGSNPITWTNLLTISSVGNTVITGTLKVNGTGGFTIGSVAGANRIEIGTSGFTRFAFLDTGNAYLGISAKSLSIGATGGDTTPPTDGAYIQGNTILAGTLTVSGTGTSSIAGLTLIGSITSAGRLNQKLEVHNVSPTTFGSAAFFNWNNDTSQPILDFNKSRGTSVGSYTVVANGDILGSIVFRGADGGEFINGAIIQATVVGTPGDNDMPTDMTFLVTADGASSSSLAMTIKARGLVNVGASSWTTGNADVKFAVITPFAATDTTARIGTVIHGTNDASNPFVLVTQIVGSATAANRAAYLHTGHLGLDNLGILALQPFGSLVAVNSAVDYTRLGQTFQVQSPINSNYGGMALVNWGGASYHPILDLNRSRGTTAGSYTAVQNGDGIGAIGFRGSNGTAFSDGGSIIGYATETWSGTVKGSRFIFYTNTTGTTTQVESFNLLSTQASFFGVTQSTWTGNFRPIEIGRKGNWIGGNAAAAQVWLGANHYFNTEYRFANSGEPATRYESQTGSHYLYRSASGTADTAVTFFTVWASEGTGASGTGNIAIGESASVNTRFHIAFGGAGDTAYTSSATSTNDGAFILVRPASISRTSGSGNLHGIIITDITMNTVTSETHALYNTFHLGASSIGGTGTVSDGTTLYISGAPTGGTVTRRWAIWVDAGTARFDGDIGTSSFKVPNIYATNVIADNVSASSGGLFPDGSQSSPSISFTNDTDTGFYRIGSGNIGVTCNNSTVLDISSSVFTVSVATNVSGAVQSRHTGTNVGFGIFRGYTNSFPSTVPELALHRINISNNGIEPINANANKPTGFLFVYQQDATRAAEYWIEGTNNTVTEIHDIGANFTTTKGNAGTTNIYYDTTNARYEIENKTGATVAYHLFLLNTWYTQS